MKENKRKSQATGFIQEVIELSPYSSGEILKRLRQVEEDWYWSKFNHWRHNPDNLPIKYLGLLGWASGLSGGKVWQLIDDHYGVDYE